MRELWWFALAGWLLLSGTRLDMASDNETVNKGQPRADVGVKLVSRLRFSPNIYVQEQAAEALVQMENGGVEALKNAMSDEFCLAKESANEGKKRSHLMRVAAIAKVLGRIGPALYVQGAGDELLKVARNEAKVTAKENKTEDTLREARGAAIEALGRIFTPSQERELLVQVADQAGEVEKNALAANDALMQGNLEMVHELIKKVEESAKKVDRLSRVLKFLTPVSGMVLSLQKSLLN